MTTTKQTTNRPVHYYDTQKHRVACGAPMADEHSTKHARGVTCAACLGVLRETTTDEVRSGAAGATAGL
jgi:hypothetical protein